MPLFDPPDEDNAAPGVEERIRALRLARSSFRSDMLRMAWNAGLPDQPALAVPLSVQQRRFRQALIVIDQMIEELNAQVK